MKKKKIFRNDNHISGQTCFAVSCSISSVSLVVEPEIPVNTYYTTVAQWIDYMSPECLYFVINSERVQMEHSCLELLLLTPSILLCTEETIMESL